VSDLQDAVRLIQTAIRDGFWVNPGSNELRRILGSEHDLPEVELFSTVAAMQNVALALDRRYVGQAQFCMVRSIDDLDGPHDPRLVLSRALIIVGSVVPGDDVFAAVEDRPHSSGLLVRVFDWNSPVPDRWKDVMQFSQFIAELQHRRP
jgi:hypothetical protein